MISDPLGFVRYTALLSTATLRLRIALKILKQISPFSSRNFTSIFELKRKKKQQNILLPFSGRSSCEEHTCGGQILRSILKVNTPERSFEGWERFKWITCRLMWELEASAKLNHIIELFGNIYIRHSSKNQESASLLTSGTVQ